MRDSDYTIKGTARFRMTDLIPLQREIIIVKSPGKKWEQTEKWMNPRSRSVICTDKKTNPGFRIIGVAFILVMIMDTHSLLLS